jgi:hypothetical protein
MKSKWLWIVGGLVLLYLFFKPKKKAAAGPVTPAPSDVAPTADAQLPSWLRNVTGALFPTQSTAQRSGTGGVNVGVGGSSIDVSGLFKWVADRFKPRPLTAAAADKQIQAAQFKEAENVLFPSVDYTGPTRDFAVDSPSLDFYQADVSPFGDWWTDSSINMSVDSPATWVDDSFNDWNGGEWDTWNDMNGFDSGDFAYV